MASSIFNTPMKTMFISGNAMTPTNKIGSTGLYVAGVNIVTLSGISRDRIRGFLPTSFGDVAYNDWVIYMGLRDQTVGIGSVHPQQNVHVEGYVLYE